MHVERWSASPLCTGGLTVWRDRESDAFWGFIHNLEPIVAAAKPIFWFSLEILTVRFWSLAITNLFHREAHEILPTQWLGLLFQSENTDSVHQTRLNWQHNRQQSIISYHLIWVCLINVWQTKKMYVSLSLSYTHKHYIHTHLYPPEMRSCVTYHTWKKVMKRCNLRFVLLLNHLGLFMG